MFSLPSNSSQNVRKNVSKHPHNHVELHYGGSFSQEKINHKPAYQYLHGTLAVLLSKPQSGLE